MVAAVGVVVVLVVAAVVFGEVVVLRLEISFMVEDVTVVSVMDCGCCTCACR
jgi:hypothetical protein